MRSRSVWVAVVLACSAATTAQAQPTVNPYDDAAAPTTTPTTPPTAPAATATPAPTPPGDPLVVAQALVARARQLLDADFPEDAIVLAEEALRQTSDADVTALARAIIDAARARLGQAPPPTVVIPPITTPTPAATPEPADLDHPVEPFDRRADARFYLSLHGAFAGAALGGGIGLAASDESTAITAAGAGGGAVVGFLAGSWAAGKYKLDTPQARTIGSGSMVGAVLGGLFADVVNVDDSSAGEIGLGVALGSVIGVAGGAIVARNDQLSSGDVALMDTFALYGIAGGLALGAAMQPPKDEAYSLNAVLGGAGGWVIGAVVGPRIDASPRRVTRMLLGAIALGGAPWLVYAGIKDDSTTNDEQVVGFVSSVGIVSGAYLGYRFSGKFAGEEVGPDGTRVFRDDAGAADRDNSATALLRHSARGGWSLGPAVPRAARVEGGRAWVLDLAAGSF